MDETTPNFLDILPLKQVLQTVPSGLFLVDLDQRIVYWNAEAERITGYSAAEAVGKHCSFLEGIPCGKGCGLYNDNIRKPIIGVACSVKTCGGRRITLLKNVDYLRNDQGEIVGGMESFTDITRQMRLGKKLRHHTGGLEKEVKQQTADLEEERSQLRNVLEAMADFAYICSADHQILFMNRAMISAFGNQAGSICYKDLYALSSPCEGCPLGQVLRGETFRQERVIAKSGRIYEIMHTPLRAPDGSLQKLAVFRDITVRKEMEKELISTKSRLEHLLTSNPAVIYTARPSGDYGATFISENIRDLLGYEPQQFTDDPSFWANNIHPEDRERVFEELPTCIQNGHGIHEYRFRHGDGTYRWMRDEFRRVRGPGDNPPEIVGYWIDISERRKAEEKLQEVNEDLDAFVYTVSHDLRTPLTPIIGYAEFLKDEYRDRLDEQALDILDEIECQGERMLALMEDLLGLARAGQVETPAVPVEAGKIVQEVLKTFSGPINKDGIVVAVEALPTLSVPESLLSQVFANLIGNAIRYAGAPGARVEVGGERENDRVRFFIRDHGPGIPPEERERVFDLFYRGSTAEKTTGTGIGLATVRKTARLFDGRVWVEETPGGGSTFWVEFSAGEKGRRG